MLRKATEKDVNQLANLMGELGYPTTNNEMQQRFAKISANPNYQTFVVEQDGVIVGMIGMMLGIAYENNDHYVRIIALVVASTYRKQGIGERLISAAEQWALENHASKIALNSGNRDERNNAHLFYQHCGFAGSATGFYKKLNKMGA